MSFLELFTLVASSVAIFGLIVGIFAVYNGRMTRREVSREIRETQESTERIIADSRKATERMTAETQRLIIEGRESTEKLITEIWGRSEAILKMMSEEHKAMLERTR